MIVNICLCIHNGSAAGLWVYSEHLLWPAVGGQRSVYRDTHVEVGSRLPEDLRGGWLHSNTSERRGGVLLHRIQVSLHQWEVREG